MIFDRLTVARVVEFEGLGLHSGEPVRLSIQPGDSGIGFRLGSRRWAAVPENVVDTGSCTKLGGVSTIEHLMSALAAAEITDAEIELTAPEVPALDGSAKQFLSGLKQAGAEVVGQRRFKGLFTRVFLQSAYGKLAIGQGEGHWKYIFDSEDRYPFHQSFEALSVVASYESEIAPARTFGWEVDLEMIRVSGMAKGLSLESALLLGTDGPVNAARFEDEPARHKLLDCIGDLYLAGVPIRLLNVVSEKSGHKANVEAASKLRAAARFED